MEAAFIKGEQEQINTSHFSKFLSIRLCSSALTIQFVPQRALYFVVMMLKSLLPFILTSFLIFSELQITAGRSMKSLFESRADYKRLLHVKFWQPSLHQEIPCNNNDIQTVTLVPGYPWRFYSPEFPRGEYDSMLTCTWRFRIANDSNVQRVAVICDHVDIAGNFFDDCRHGDYLTVLPQSDDHCVLDWEFEQSTEKLCGNLLSWTPLGANLTVHKSKASYNQNVWIRFSSNGEEEASGFSCRIMAYESKESGDEGGTPSTTSHPPTSTTTSTTTDYPETCPISDDSFCACGRVKVKSGLAKFLNIPLQLSPTIPDALLALMRPDRVVGGNDTMPHQYPWQVALTYVDFLFCGGSLVSKRHVITAAHCTDLLLNFEYDHQEFRVRLSEYDLNTHKDCDYSIVVKRIFQHHKFNSSNFDYDISILELEEPVECTDYVSPICLPDSANDPFDKRMAVATGWGVSDINTGASSDILQQVFVKTLTNADCKQQTNYHSSNITNTMICAGETGKDTCQGDSGGPLAVVERDVFTLIGVTSWGIGCGMSGYPGVYARVTSVLKWIKKIIGKSVV